MTSITAPKSGPLNWLEGFALTATLQGLPIFAATPLIVKLMGGPRIGSPALFVLVATMFYSLLAIWAPGRNFRDLPRTVLSRCSSIPTCPSPTRSPPGAPNR